MYTVIYTMKKNVKSIVLSPPINKWISETWRDTSMKNAVKTLRLQFYPEKTEEWGEMG